MIEDIRIQAKQSLVKPEALLSELPLTSNIQRVVSEARTVISDILNGIDQRLLVIVGPCSIHDPEAALEYATRLQLQTSHLKKKLFIVMRTYFEKPRTTLGWKGLINDPFLDKTFEINAGLRIARKLLLDISHLGVPTATEFLDPFIPSYLSDLISWCAIGARTSESQLHREMASGLPMPVGFKNNTDGNIQIAVDAAHVASQPQLYLSINKQGIPSILQTKGNPVCHIVLRGSNSKSNFSLPEIQNAIALLQQAQLFPRLVIDCSHGNSMKNHLLQANVVETVSQYLQQGIKSICGIMLESNLIAGKQHLQSNDALIYGQSITDACIDWDETMLLLEKLSSIN